MAELKVALSCTFMESVWSHHVLIVHTATAVAVLRAARLSYSFVSISLEKLAQLVQPPVNWATLGWLPRSMAELSAFSGIGFDSDQKRVMRPT